MNEQEYLEQRLDDQINWYDRKSGAAQRAFKRLRLIEIVAAATIPLLAGFAASGFGSNGGFNWTNLAVAGLGVVVAVVAGVLALYRFEENWIKYRTTCESLRHHKFRYITKSAPYNGTDAFRILVDTVENLISQENTQWSANITQRAEQQDEGDFDSAG